MAAQQVPQDKWDRADFATVRLSPDSIPDLPAPIRAHLRLHGCLIPQSPEVARIHNVGHGHFQSDSVVDWVALCSIARVSRILVYWGGDTSRVDSFPPAPDRDYLQGMGGDTIAFSHVINVVDARYIREHADAYGGPLPPSPIHDGIDDGFMEKASVVRYWSRGAWLSLAGAD